MIQITHGVMKRLTITGSNGLDPVDVITEDFGDGRGRVIVRCWDKIWTAYWGAMPESTVMEFLKKMDAQYMHKNLSPRRYNIYESRHLARVIAAVKEGLKVTK